MRTASILMILWIFGIDARAQFEPDNPVKSARLVVDNSDDARLATAVDRLKQGDVSPDVEQTLIELLDAFEYPVRSRALSALGSIDNPSPEVFDAILYALEDQDSTIRWNATILLYKMGPAARDAIPHLADLYRYEGSSEHVVMALLTIDPTAKGWRSTLADMVLGTQPDTANHCLRKIKEMVDEDETLAAEYFDLLKDMDPEVRAAGAIIMQRLGSKAEGAYPLLLESLNDKSAKVRRLVPTALIAVSTPEPADRQRIAALLEDDDIYVRIMAARVMWKSERNPDRVVPVISTALRKAAHRRLDDDSLHFDETNEQFVAAALATLGEIGKDAKAALPILHELYPRPGWSDLDDPLTETLRKINPAFRF